MNYICRDDDLDGPNIVFNFIRNFTLIENFYKHQHMGYPPSHFSLQQLKLILLTYQVHVILALNSPVTNTRAEVELTLLSFTNITKTHRRIKNFNTA